MDCEIAANTGQEMQYRDHAGIPKIVLKKVLKKRSMTYLNFPKELQCARWVSGMLKEFRNAHCTRKLAVAGLLLNPP
eukprot:9349618-Prorocentrum_lima.AAC.1